MKLPQQYRKGKSLESLVENRTTYSHEAAELHIFETHEQAQAVHLRFSYPTLATMITGKKIMHLSDKADFAFLPGESILLPSNELMRIDFPQAQAQDPTKCLAMTIDEVKIRSIVQMLNERQPKESGEEWALADGNFHFSQEQAVHQLIQRLIFLFVEAHPEQTLFIDMLLQELLIRVLRSHSRTQLLLNAQQHSHHHRLAHAIDFIRQHLHEKLSLRQISLRACMSESQLYRAFRQELGLSPIEFIHRSRLQLAATMLLDKQQPKIGDISLACGFQNLSHFNRAFKEAYACTPSAYRQQGGGSR